jgi:hypothetical protein
MPDTIITVTAEVDLSTQILQALAEMLQSGGFWLLVAMLTSMVVVQGAKVVLKAVVPIRFRRLRKWGVFVLAYIVGFQCGMYFIDGEDRHKWSVFVGLVNPVIYFLLVQYALSGGRMVLLSVLKMRPLVKADDGTLSLGETQTFMVKD